MSCSADLHVADTGSQFIVTFKDCDVVVDISSATLLQIIFHKPDGSEVTKTAILYTDGTDGKAYYTTISGDLDIGGWWVIQGYIEVGTLHWHSDTKRFRVLENI
jgi:hypothetical protein